MGEPGVSATLREIAGAAGGASPEVEARPSKDEAVSAEALENARREAFQLVATARKEAERIIGEAHDEAKRITDQASSGIGKLASLGDSTDELFAHIKSLIKRQKEFDAERRTLMEQIAELELERDILTHRIALGGMEPADVPEPEPEQQQPPADDRPFPVFGDPAPTLAEPAPVTEESPAPAVEDSLPVIEPAPVVEEPPAPIAEEPLPAPEEPDIPPRPSYRDEAASPVADTRSFYSRRSAKLPRLGDQAGRDALTSLKAIRKPREDDDEDYE
jgi:hypothetical protein